MKRPKMKTGGNGDAAHGWNNESLSDQASPVNSAGTRATKSEKIKAALKAKAENFKSQTIKVDENWSIVRRNELNWQIRHKDRRTPYDKWFFGTLRGALLALPDKMLGEEAKGAIEMSGDVIEPSVKRCSMRCQKGALNEPACCISYRALPGRSGGQLKNG